MNRREAMAAGAAVVCGAGACGAPAAADVSARRYRVLKAWHRSTSTGAMYPAALLAALTPRFDGLPVYGRPDPRDWGPRAGVARRPEFDGVWVSVAVEWADPDAAAALVAGGHRLRTSLLIADYPARFRDPFTVGAVNAVECLYLVPKGRATWGGEG